MDYFLAVIAIDLGGCTTINVQVNKYHIYSHCPVQDSYTIVSNVQAIEIGTGILLIMMVYQNQGITTV